MNRQISASIQDSFIFNFIIRILNRIRGPLHLNLAKFSRDSKKEKQPNLSRPKILFAINSLDLQGAPLSVLELTRALVLTHNYELQILAPSKGPLISEFQKLAPVKIFKPPHINAKSGRAYERNLHGYCKELSALEPDLIVANTLDCFYAIDASQSLGVAKVWAIRESFPLKSFFAIYPPALQRRARACEHYCEQLVFVADHISEEWPPHPNKTTIRTSPNKQEIEHKLLEKNSKPLLTLAEDAKVLLCVGTICRNKNQASILKAFEIAAEQIDTLNLLLIGEIDNAYSREFARLLSRLPRATRQRIHLMQGEKEVWVAYRRADYFVAASRREGYPRTVFEALAASLPIIASDIPAHREILGDCEAVYFNPTDSEKLANAITKIYQQGSGQMQIAAKQRWLEIESVNATAERYADLIRDTLNAIST